METKDVREAVKARYGAAALRVVTGKVGCCGDAGAPTCGPEDPVTRDLYDASQTAQLPAEAVAASLGCGNPTALAELRPGEVVLDLGSGGGIDVLLSARRVGPVGKAYGLDMTPEMLSLARENQRRAGVTNVEFLEGHIERVPLPDAAVDVIISNCVINLSGDKDAVLREAFRVLRPGGRFAVSDIVLLRPMPDAAMRVMALWTGCVAGALTEAEYVAKLRAVGFSEVTIEHTRVYAREEAESLLRDGEVERTPALERALSEMDGQVVSAFVRARKPTP